MSLNDKLAADKYKTQRSSFQSTSALPKINSGKKRPSQRTVPRVVTPQFTHRNFNRILRLYIPFDIISIVLGYICALGVAILTDKILLGRVFVINNFEMREFLLISAGVIAWFIHTNHYRIRTPFWTETNNILKTFGFAALVNGFMQFALKYDFSRLWLVLGWMLAAGFVILSRNLLRLWLRRTHRFQVPTLLIGGGETAKHTRAALLSEPSLGYEVVAQTRNLSPAFTQEGQSWQRLCYAYGAEYIIIALDGREMQDAELLIAQLTRESVPFSISPPLRHLPLLGMVSQHFFNHDVLLMTNCNTLEQPLSRFIKRTFDIAVSSSILLLASPVLLIIGLMVKRDGGPMLYGHLRVGQSGKVFSCLKFRSMAVNGNAALDSYLEAHPEARAEWESARKLRNDPRVTPIGQLLRKSSLDELPQLINVLKGDMSLVGPRPIVRDEITNYAHDISFYYNVRPGITGLWQVSGRNDVTYAQRVKMDSWYVRNWSLWQDIAILFKTFPAVFKRSGAY